MHARIANLSTQTAPVYQFTPPAQQLRSDLDFAEEPEGAYLEAPDRDETVADWPGAEEQPVSRLAWDEPAAAAIESPVDATSGESSLQTVGAGTTAPSGSSQTIAGRVLVSISPVPDFDRLLSLDGALGRMSGVGNVTLADYAREEVTFRVEVDPPTSVEDFRNRLSVSAGASIEVVASGDDGLALRLAS